MDEQAIKIKIEEVIKILREIETSLGKESKESAPKTVGLVIEDPLKLVRESKINTQKYPLVTKKDPIILQGLWILCVCFKECGLHELSAAQIAKIAPWFRLKVSRQAINQGFEADKNKPLLNTRVAGSKKIFYSVRGDKMKVLEEVVKREKT